ncbi:hypothetical protein PR003_g10513 [Phytophthora rubi]|uniref:ZSWIM1/3 RNaseH-like domain-containing protein n=1 Tax=Phytophthora rubi TaxID=129364 RepID=A0A6A3MIZ5_9STRA|nr:hypothetical protein PR002_g10122 [Phytophthora rubi]KAE9033574.1 hypothetical protein PR001_g10107 [Phytophthora rubi]KAE9340367.1 hypothetical protein PR003_g10513 [Phytophthora rubi]
MDFTHAINNLGYHLGSLVVTTASGMVFPVLDFITLNQQTVTIATILNYFKEQSPGWHSIASVVIDTGFVEWRVLEESYPDAKILSVTSTRFRTEKGGVTTYVSIEGVSVP